ncbi:MAG: hypothetical protein GY718_03795 [Lentisphaerae bacterium]|nr:hypothetical protein [Lentisphaerota bacterium]
MKQRHIRIISKTATWLFAISLGFSFCRVCVKYEFAPRIVGIVLTTLLLIILAVNMAYCLAGFYKKYQKRQAKQQAWQDHITKELGKTKDGLNYIDRYRRDIMSRLSELEETPKDSA